MSSDPVQIANLQVKLPLNHNPFPQFKEIVNQLFIPVENIIRNKHLHLSIKKSDVVRRFVQNYRENVGFDILPVARLYFPKWDRERIYMIKEFKLGSIVCKYLNLGKGNEDYKRIHEWKRLSYNRMRSTVKFSDLLVDVISKRRIQKDIPINEGLNVIDVNNLLDNLCKLGNNPKDLQYKLITGAIIKMTDGELRYFFRIVLKSDPVGSEGAFLSSWHPDARRLYELTHDLKLVFWGLSDPCLRLSEQERQIRLMLPFTPQRCQRVINDYAKIPSENFEDESFIMEEKFDGERMQVHIKKVGKGFHFKYFTRNAMDYTDIYGMLSKDNCTENDTGCISSFLGKDNFHENLQDCILDGEMICYDPILKTSLPYSVVKASALHGLALNGKMKQARAPHPMFVAFDCVYLNGCSLEMYPLDQRKDALNYIIKKPYPNLFVKAEYSIARTGDEIERAMTKAIGSDSEGLVLKSIKSMYVVGSTSKLWIKIKPEYLEEFGENLDLIIMGKIPGTKTSFLCGLRDDIAYKGKKEKHTIPLPTEEQCHFVALCKISNGFSVDDYRYIDKQTAGNWIEFKSNPPDPNLLKFGSLVPVSWIDPKNSIVIEVRARSITLQASQTYYATSTTLYNAYCVKIRDDKDWKTASTLSGYNTSSNQGRIHSRQGVFNKHKKKRIHRPSKRDYMLKELNESYNINNTTGQTEDRLFKGLIISIKTDCIYKGRLTSIKKLNQIVWEHGGELSRNPESVLLDSDKNQKLIVVADRMTMEVQALNGRYNIFKFKWIEDCISTKMVVSPDLSHILMAESSLLQLCRSNQHGIYGNMIIPLNKFTFWGLGSNSLIKITDKLPEDKFNDYLIFYKMNFMILSTPEHFTIASIVEEKIRMNGGKITKDLGEASTVVVVYEAEDVKNGCTHYEPLASMVKKTMIKRSNHRLIPRIVYWKYIDACIEENALVDPVEFKVILPEESLGSGRRKNTEK